MTRRGFRTFSVALLAVTPLALAACGGDDDDAAPGGTAAAADDSGGSDLEAQVVAELMDDAEEGGPTQEQAECAAAQFVDAFGEERVQELLDAPDESDMEELLSADEQETFMTAALSCLDVRELMVEQFVAQGFSDEDANCVVDELGEDTLSEMAAASAAGESPDQAAITGAVTACGITDM